MATENILIKFISDNTGLKDSVAELQKIGKLSDEDAKKFQQMEGFAEGIADALKEAGIDAKTFNKEVKDSALNTKTLAAQINEARNNAVQMSRAFGAGSQQAKEAAANVAKLKDEQDKLNKAIFASDPGKRFEVYGKAVQGVQGAFQAATGAMQIFGVENERITKLAQQFQGALNITQGINSISQLKDVYSQLGTILGVTTSAQKALNVAEGEGVIVTNSLKVATTSLSTAGIGALVVGFIALIGYLSQVGDSFDNTSESIESYKKIQDLLKESTDKLAESLDKLKVARGEITQLEADEAKLLKEIAKENQANFALRDKILESIKEEESLLNKNLSLLDAAKNSNRESASIQAITFAKNVEISKANIKAKQDELAENDKLIKSVNDRYVVELKLLRENSKEKEKAKKEGKDTEVEAINLMRELGLETIKTKDELVNLSDEGFNKMEDALRIVNANAFEVKKNIVAINRELKNLSVISVDIKKSGTDYNAELIKRTDDTIEAEDKTREYLFASAQQLNTSILNITKARDEREMQDLDEKRKRGLITEEKYQQEIKKIQSRAAAAEKQSAIFSALIGIANGIINALNSKTVPVPVAVGIASAIGAAQLAAIIATPIPKFKKGTLNLGRGNLDADGGMHIIAHEGEAIIPKDRNREYHPTIKALYHRQIKASEINAFVQSKLAGKMNHNVNAKINTKELARAMSGSDNVNIKNTSVLARQIGREIASNINRRRS